MKSVLYCALIMLISCSCSSMNKSVMIKSLDSDITNLVSDKKENDHGLRLLYLTSEVNEESTSTLISQIDEANKDENVKEILIEINSPGGAVNEGFLLSKSIEDSEKPVQCVVDGQADSMAFYILQSCKTRAMTKRSVLMIHGPSIEGSWSGHYTEWENIAAFLRTMERAMVEHMCARLNIPADKMFDMIRGSTQLWYSWQGAINIGAVDVVAPNVSTFKHHLGY